MHPWLCRCLDRAKTTAERSPHANGDDQRTNSNSNLIGWHAYSIKHLTMDAALSGFNLGTVLLFSCGFFVLATLYFGTRGGYYNTDKYDGNGTAH